MPHFQQGNFQNLLSTSRVILGDLFIGSVPCRNTDTGSESLLPWDLKRFKSSMGVCLMNLFVHGGAQPSLIEHFPCVCRKIAKSFWELEHKIEENGSPYFLVPVAIFGFGK